jgi:hypothetical protein
VKRNAVPVHPAFSPYGTASSGTCAKKNKKKKKFFSTPFFHYAITNDSGTCAKRTSFFSTPPFRHALLLVPVRVRAMWRWSSSMQIQRPSPSISTPPFCHTTLLGSGTCAKRKRRSFPPRPSTPHIQTEKLFFISCYLHGYFLQSNSD